MDDCERFLARQVPWIRGILEGKPHTLETVAALARPDGFDLLNKAEEEYIQLLERCPEKLRAYRKRLAEEAKRQALSSVPALPVGAPRKDWIAIEASALNKAGMTHSQIAEELNKRHPTLMDKKGNPSPLTKEIIRKHLAKVRRYPPEKT